MANLSPLDPQPFVDRIAAGGNALLLVGLAADNASAIEGGPQVTPSAFVIVPTYRATGNPNAGGGRIAQMTEWQIPVLTVVRHYGDAAGSKASAESKAARAQVFAQMVGFMPDPNGFAVQALSGRLLTFKNQCLYYVDVFKLNVHITNAETP